MMKDDRCLFLPIVDITDESFFFLNQDKSDYKINGLIDKYILFKLLDEERSTIQFMVGKLLGYKDNKLLIRQYDDGTDETIDLWKDNDGKDLFKNFEEYIPLKNIAGIEEYMLPNFKFDEHLNNSICEITSHNNKKIIVLIKEFDGFEVLFDYKYKENDKELIAESSIPLCLIKCIKDMELKFDNNVKDYHVDNGTSTNFYIEGDVSKINHISGKIKRIILEGYFSNIIVKEINQEGLLLAKLKDDTGIIQAVLFSEDSVQFRKLVNKVRPNEKYRVYGTVTANVKPLEEIIERINSREKTNINIDIEEGFIIFAYNIELI